MKTKKTHGRISVFKSFIPFLCDTKSGMIICTLILFFIMIFQCIAFLGFSFLLHPIQENPGLMQFYLIDYKVGFVSRALIGEIISWFTDSITPAQVSVISTVAVAASLFLQASIGSAALRKAIKQKDYLIILLVGMLLINPATVIWNVKVLGLLDVYTLLVFFLYLIPSKSKTMIFLSPLIILLGLSIHCYFAFAFLPGIAAFQFYYLCREGKNKKVRLIFFIISCLVGFFFTAYFIFGGRYAARMSADELYEYMKTKYDGDFQRSYFDFYIFGIYQEQEHNSVESISRFMMNFTFANSSISKELLLYCILCIIPIVICSFFWIKLYKIAPKNQKLSFLCFLLMPIFLLVTCLFSTDFDRYASAWAIMVPSILMQIYITNDPLILQVFSDLRVKTKKMSIKTMILFAFLLYTFTGILWHKTVTGLWFRIW